EHQELARLGGARRRAAARAVDEAHLADDVAGAEGGQRAVHVAADVLEDVDPALLDDEQRVARVVLAKQLLAADEFALLASPQEHVGVLGSQLGEEPPAVQLAFLGHTSCIARTRRSPQVIRRAAPARRRSPGARGRGSRAPPRAARSRRSARAAPSAVRAAGPVRWRRAWRAEASRSPPAASARTPRPAALPRRARAPPLPAARPAASTGSPDARGPLRSACASAR